MRKPIKKIKNLQNRDYVNMYIVYLLFLKNFEILRNIAIICKKLPPATPEGIIRYKLDTGLHCFYLPYFAIFRNTFRNISKFLLKSFERNAYRNLSKDCDSFERFRVNRNSFERFRHAISFKRFRIFILLMKYYNMVLSNNIAKTN